MSAKGYVLEDFNLLSFIAGVARGSTFTCLGLLLAFYLTGTCR